MFSGYWVLGTRYKLLLPDHRRRHAILRKHLEHYFPRVRRNFLVHVARIFRQCALQHEVALVPRLLPFAALHRPLKIERNPVNNLSRKAQLVSVKLATLEELIEEGSLVAVSVAEPGNESGDVSRLLDRHL